MVNETVDGRLNEMQLKAAMYENGPMFVFAGPGSGKTTVIIERVKYLIESCKVDSSSIAVITFTKMSADEMKNRFMKICSIGQGVSFGTFHSLFFRILRQQRFMDAAAVMADEERINIIKNICSENSLEMSYDEEFCRDVSSEISLMKNKLMNIHSFIPCSCQKDDFIKIYEAYEKAKSDLNKIDFDDMLIDCYELLMHNEAVRQYWSDKYKYMLIDEFQDINQVQYECIKLISKKDGNIFAVGDDDQSIYGFRGSNPEFFRRFERDFEGVEKVVLNVNYRSTEQIISLCNAIIKENSMRFNKIIKGTGREGKMPVLIRCEDINDEAKKIAEKIKKLAAEISFTDMAVIYRANIQSRAIVDSFMNYNIPFQFKDMVPSIYEHWLARDIYAYLRLSLDKTYNDGFERIANKPSRYIDKITIFEVKNHLSDGASLIDALHKSHMLKKYAADNLGDMIYRLNVLKNKNTADAFKYIRNTIGYNEYLKNFAEYRKIKYDGLIEILDELEYGAQEYENIEDYLKYVDRLIQEIKNQRLSRKKSAPAEGVMLSTMHSVKGLEFDTVFVISVIEDIVPHERSIFAQEIEEERRLFYVALTRAKNRLFVSIPEFKHDKKTEPSRFLKNIIRKSPQKNKRSQKCLDKPSIN